MILSDGRVQNFWKYELHKRGKYEDTDIDSNIGVTAPGARPDGTTTDAGADERNANYCSYEREEDATRSGPDRSAGKT